MKWLCCQMALQSFSGRAVTFAPFVMGLELIQPCADGRDTHCPNWEMNRSCTLYDVHFLIGFLNLSSLDTVQV